MDDNHSKKRKFMYGADNEYTPATPEHVVFPPGTVFTAVSTTDEQFFREYCPSTPGHATRFYPHRINAVIHRGTVFFPGTPPSTTSGRTRGISVTSLPDENTPVHGDAINGPGHNDGIGPMSERDPGIENAVNPNFNDDICENVLAVVNMSANTSIYSPPALSSRRSVHLYMPELTHSTDTTYASVDMLTSTFPAQPHAMSAFHRPDTKIYGETDTTNKKTTRFSSVTYHNFSSKKTAAPTNCNPFYFQPISEDPHIFHPIVDSDDYETSSTACNASRLIQDPEAFRIPTPFSFDRHPSPFTFASETFSPLFSHFTATDGAYDCLSTTTGITNFVEAMSSDHPTDPYRLDTRLSPTDRQHIGPNPPCALPAALL
ncbi:hypothetical protein MHU86_14827 [Fragilaria crotonensis]|nr:hypothetical protein MHU86_14827 [Fragilaria crotonensis]